MKSKEEIYTVLRNLPAEGTKFSAMTYEQGIDEALNWVIGEIENEDFPYSIGEVE